MKNRKTIWIAVAAAVVLLLALFFVRKYFVETVVPNEYVTCRVEANGESISAVTSAVYQTKHPYIGDASANGRTAGALNMAVILGSYKNELQTTTEPYEWHFLIEQEVSNLSETESYMQSYAYVLLAVVENLGEVTYEYRYDGALLQLTVTEEMATAFAGQDIKSVGEDIVALEHLMGKAELIGMAYVID